MTVKVFSKPVCPQCEMTKRTLKSKGIDFESIDISVDTEAHAMIASLGYRQVPVVMAGDQHWSGFRPDLIEQTAQSMSFA